MPPINRQALYDQVWAEPMRTVAERYELSDAGFAKICRGADIPTPPRGYWAKSCRQAPGKSLLPRGGLGGAEFVRSGSLLNFPSGASA